MIPVTGTIAIDESDIKERFIRASGPGGQNVNKVATAVQLRFDVANAKSLPESVRLGIKRLAGKRLNRDGVLVIEARRYRTRERNREDARQRLIALVRRAAQPVRPRRRPKPPLKINLRRLQAKHHRARLKRTRGPVPDAERQ